MTSNKHNRITALIEKLSDNKMSIEEYIEYECLCNKLLAGEINNLKQIDAIVDYLR
jgi:hypothetical protein